MGHKYDVYGMGNALVDMEFEVTPEQLASLGIDKGVMTLVEEARENELIAQLAQQRGKQSSGGSAANTLVALAQLGGTGFYACKVGKDEAGAFYLQDLNDCGLDTNPHHESAGEGITGKCLVFVTPDADRTMNTFLGISGSLSVTEMDWPALRQSQYLYLEGYLVTSPSAKAACIEAKAIAEQSGVKTCLSLSDPNMAKFFQDGLKEMLGQGVDLLFANEAEALEMAGTSDLNQAIAYCKSIAKNFALTRGGEGSLIFDGENLLTISTPKVQPIDTVGAGDMYAGGFLYGLTHGMDYEKAGQLASETASRVVTCYGPRLATATLQEILQSVQAV
ncbi:MULTISPECIES: adenosine kinase [Synechocystis]|uniref:Adenosine kinase n=1 Tax=Synechocystis salina LEGE 00031 TaxID=1828736 RepID=A0ABR9VMT2_9SYNC|nr:MULTISPECIES: adenosine kinase [Synechocystis]MBE9197212.1 adenosine kinase [Synechocystis sp. LEGE 06083]MBE9239457.1 adenosine kinase [Synechocystis salina LEGE 00041]MBE9252371.1 adenosine kinase [Synechocystis salina LEGE 00031]